MAYRAIEIRRTTASNCVEMRGTAASNCMEMRGTAARKCVEMRGTAACVGMRVAWTPPNRDSSARDASGKRAGSSAQVRLKRVEPRFHALVGHVFIWDRHVKGKKKTHDFLSNLNQLRLFRFDLFGICGFVWLMTFNNRYFSQCLRFLAEVSWPEFGHYQTKSITYTICRSCGSVFSAIFIEVSI